MAFHTTEPPPDGYYWFTSVDPKRVTLLINIHRVKRRLYVYYFGTSVFDWFGPKKFIKHFEGTFEPIALPKAAQ